jgi:hypothetical protein
MTQVQWRHNVFSGDPPEGYGDWYEWVLSPTKSGAFIRANTAEDWGPSDSARAASAIETQPTKDASLLHGQMKSFLITAGAVFCGLLLGFTVKAGIQWYGCKAYGLFSDTYCALQVLMR